MYLLFQWVPTHSKYSRQQCPKLNSGGIHSAPWRPLCSSFCGCSCYSNSNGDSNSQHGSSTGAAEPAADEHADEHESAICTPGSGVCVVCVLQEEAVAGVWKVVERMGFMHEWKHACMISPAFLIKISFLHYPVCLPLLFLLLWTCYLDIFLPLPKIYSVIKNMIYTV